jgi:hypothetical protein
LSYSNKAVAVGAAAFYVDHLVIGRISKFTYGVPCNAVYEPSDPEHVQRKHKSYIDPSGERRVPGYFMNMLLRVGYAQSPPSFPQSHSSLQGTKVLKDREIRESFYWLSKISPTQHISSEILKYKGTADAPEWVDTEQGKASSLP